MKTQKIITIASFAGLYTLQVYKRYLTVINIVKFKKYKNYTSGCFCFCVALKSTFDNLRDVLKITVRYSFYARFYTFTTRKMKNVKINGDTFYFKKFEPVKNRKTHLNDLYNNASVYKWNAFNYWNDKMFIYGMTGNSCKFTIYGQVKDENGIEHDVKITADNNWILN